MLSDIVMPAVDGLALVKELAQRRPGVRIVLVSGFSAATAGKHGVDSIDVPLLRKPFSREELTAALGGGSPPPPRS